MIMKTAFTMMSLIAMTHSVRKKRNLLFMARTVTIIIPMFRIAARTIQNLMVMKIA